MSAARLLVSLVPLTVSLATWAVVPGSHRPVPGRYDATLCVSVNQAKPKCGPVSFELDAEGNALLRVADIGYRLQLRESELDVFLFHGTMQIDEFSARYQWLGRALHFTDEAKRTRFELQLLAPN